MLLWLPLIETAGQQFWELTGEFPGEPKIGIAIAADSILFAGLTDGIIRSPDGGGSFQTVLKASAVHSMYVSGSGVILAGGTGRIYSSADLGSSWDSVPVSSAYPVLQIIENKEGALFAITGGYDDTGYKGDGVFHAPGPGGDWEQRNGGLGSYTGSEKIAIDSNGRLYLAVHDHFVTGNGGLFISEDNGLHWEHVAINIDGKKDVEDRMKIEFTTGLSISPGDSVYLSFQGIAGKGMVRLNLKKHIGDVKGSGNWSVFTLMEPEQWWLDRTLYNIFFSGDGLWYSSTSGSLHTGGTWYTRDGSSGWEQVTQNLGYYPQGGRDPQYYTEDAKGRIFMVQFMGERVFTRTAYQSPVALPPGTSPATMTVYPNPAMRGQSVSLAGSRPEAGPFFLFDGTGRKVADLSVFGEPVQFPAPGEPGMYYLLTAGREKNSVIKLVVL